MAKAATRTTTTLTSTRGLVSFANMHSNLPQWYFRATSRGSSPGNSQKIPSQIRWTGMMSGVPEARVLVVDDEDSITDLVATALRYVGFEVAVAANGRQALEQAAAFRPELVVLDVMLPDLDGFEVVRRLRADGLRMPVVFLTARDATEDKVAGLTIGGDDYVTKPFSLEELVARVRAVLRRTRGDDDGSSRLQFGDLELDEDTHEVWRAGASVALTARVQAAPVPHAQRTKSPVEGTDPRPRLGVRLRG